MDAISAFERYNVIIVERPVLKNIVLKGNCVYDAILASKKSILIIVERLVVKNIVL